MDTVILYIFMDTEIPVTARKWKKKMQEKTAAIMATEEAVAVPAHALALAPVPEADAPDAVKRILTNLKLKNNTISGLKSLDLRPDAFICRFSPHRRLSVCEDSRS